MHGGYFNVKLCKLNSSSDVVSQDCFDQEALKIVSIDDYQGSYMIDDYNVKLAYPSEATNIKFT